MAKILLIHGPNLNLLGQREPSIYGNATLKSVNSKLEHQVLESKLQFESFQSNHEGEIIDRLHQSKKEAVSFIVINPAALTHTSIALRDAFLAIEIPFIETHLSNISERETFRQVSYLSDIAQGVISGFGVKSYELAIRAAIEYCHHNCV